MEPEVDGVSGWPQTGWPTLFRRTNARLWIQDNGIGIPPAFQHRLFGIFERMHPEQKLEGTDIGLAIVRKAVERMNGTVGVVSNGKAGSRFWIELPVPSIEPVRGE